MTTREGRHLFPLPLPRSVAAVDGPGPTGYVRRMPDHRTAVPLRQFAGLDLARPLVMGIVIVSSAAVWLGNAIAEVLQLVNDKRLRESETD